jgi:riboflavin kinase/FMN adenylyltransferase
VIQKACDINGTSVAITFEPHPLRALGISLPPLITRRDQKIELLANTGVDKILCLPFTTEFAEIPAKTFVKDLLFDTIGMKAIITGADYTFGRNRTGNVALLESMGKTLGFETIVLDWITDRTKGHGRISSTLIRDIVMEGRVEEAKTYLGRHYQIRGKVIKGRQRGGSQLGFPTANIKLHDELCPKMGVYAVTVETEKGNFKGVANIGFSPTFDDHLFTVEVHLFDFAYNIYNTRIRVNMIARLRDEKRFSSIKELSEQIRLDIEKAKEILNHHEHTDHIGLP